MALAGSAAATTWEDATARVGIEFRHAGEIHPDDERDFRWPGFPEIFGGGACWFDADGDGYDDLFLVNQQFNPENPAGGAWAALADPRSALYISNGDGTFRDASASSGVDTGSFGYGCSAADYDGDACADLFVSVFGASELYRSQCDGTFANVTATATPGGPLGDASYCDPGHPCMATSSAWGDYDRDGDLDLYVGTYVNTNLTDLERTPGFHVAQLNWLLRNNGDGTFTDVARAAGVAGNPTDHGGTKTLGVVWLDYDRDGWLDLYVCNDMEPNHLFRNLRDGTFDDVAVEAGVEDPRASMGVAAQDYDNDGWPDLFFTHYSSQMNGFYRNRGDGTFDDRSGEDDHATSEDFVGWGAGFVDADRDGWQDILLVNGHTEWSEDLYNQGVQYLRSDPEPNATVPWDRHWTEASRASGLHQMARAVHRGAAFADYDLDGDEDMALVNNGNQSAQLLTGSDVAHRWLNVRLVQGGANGAGVGARIALDAGGGRQYRDVQAGSSYLGQNTLTQEFGLGGAEQADRVTVEWPDGGVTVAGPVKANTTLRIDRASGAWVNDTVSPLTRARVEGLPGDHGWWRGPVTVSLEASDRGTPWASGLAGTSLARDGGTWGDAEPLELGEGVHALRFRSSDLAGNREPVRSEAVRVDGTPPEVTASLRGTRSPSGWWAGPVGVVLEGRDALSGLAELRVRVDGGPWHPYERPVVLAQDGEHEVEFAGRDVAGNDAPVGRLALRLDATPPEVAPVRPAHGGVVLGDASAPGAGAGPAVVAAWPGGVRVEARASDGASGLARVELWVDGARRAARDEAPYAWTWDTAGVAPGPHELRFVAHDRAGLAASASVTVLVAPLPAPPPPVPPLAAGPGSEGAPPAPFSPTATRPRGPRRSAPTPCAARAPRRRW